MGQAPCGRWVEAAATAGLEGGGSCDSIRDVKNEDRLRSSTSKPQRLKGVGPSQAARPLDGSTLQATPGTTPSLLALL
jgi:hypothetical protein